MPNRIIREGILTSPKLAKLGWAEEVFYRRLLSVVDDFGRYYADPGMLRAACYPRQLNKVSDSDVGKWLAQVAEAALVRVYPAEDGERYLEVVKFDQQVRAKKSKFPVPPSTCVADAKQTLANAHLDVDVDVDDQRPQAVAVELFEGIDPQVVKDFRALRSKKKAPITETAVAGIRREADKAGLGLEAALRMCCERGWTGFKADWVSGSPAVVGAPVRKRELL